MIFLLNKLIIYHFCSVILYVFIIKKIFSEFPNKMSICQKYIYIYFLVLPELSFILSLKKSWKDSIEIFHTGEFIVAKKKRKKSSRLITVKVFGVCSSITDFSLFQPRASTVPSQNRS